jgi:outer membrane receptor protein involved in Fe transport
MRDVAGDHTIANLTLSSNSFVKNADISLSIKNLFNTTYYANAQPQNVQDLLIQGGRTLQFQFNYRL